MLFVLLEAVSKAFTSILQFFWLLCWVPRDFHQLTFQGDKDPLLLFIFIKFTQAGQAHVSLVSMASRALAL